MMRATVLLSLIAIAGCGSVSATDVCKKGCQKSVSCIGGSTDQITMCQQQCDSNNALGSQLASCTNAGDILSCLDACYGVADCNDSAKCVTGCPKCITSGGGNSDLAGGDDGGGGGNPDLATASGPVAQCDAVCAKFASCTNGQISEMQCEQMSGCANAAQMPCSNFDQVSACQNQCIAGACNPFVNCIMACPRCM